MALAIASDPAFLPSLTGWAHDARHARRLTHLRLAGTSTSACLEGPTVGARQDVAFRLRDVRIPSMEHRPSRCGSVSLRNFSMLYPVYV